MEKQFETNGRELRLKYTFNSICAIEDRAGMPLEKLMSRRFTPVRLLFWGALTELQPEISLRMFSSPTAFSPTRSGCAGYRSGAFRATATY